MHFEVSRANMLYATTKDRLKRELDGFHYEVQATDPAEIDIEVIRDRVIFTTYLSIYYCRAVPLNFCYELVAVGDIFIRKIVALSDSSCFIVSLLIHGY